MENRFTGWTDVDLSDNGINEAYSAGDILKRSGFIFDSAFTSLLKRSIRTTWIVLEKMDLVWIPVHKSWRLNERHYGALQGLNKKETSLKHGEDQVRIWRRSYDVPPPPIDTEDERYPGREAKYKTVPAEDLPVGESLKDTVSRVLPYWEYSIAPRILSGEKVLISAHGNSLRALVKHLDGISDAEIPSLEIPTGVPLVYRLDEKLKALEHFYLEK